MKKHLESGVACETNAALHGKTCVCHTSKERKKSQEPISNMGQKMKHIYERQDPGCPALRIGAVG